MKRSRGFTLLEVMLAFVLLAGAMGLLIAMLSRGLHQVQWSASASEATLYAQSVLDELGVLAPIGVETRNGELGDGRYQYQLEITEVDDPAPTLAPPTIVTPAQAVDQPKLYRVVLLMSWGPQPERRLHFATLRARMPITLDEP